MFVESFCGILIGYLPEDALIVFNVVFHHVAHSEPLSRHATIPMVYISYVSFQRRPVNSQTGSLGP